VGDPQLKSDDWKNIAELVGMAAIVASLIFVGLELRQSQEIALSQTHSERSTTVIEQIISVADNSHYLSALAKRAAGNPDEVTPIEHQALLMVANAAMFSIEDAFYQHQRGFLPEERWNASRENLKWFMSGQAHIQTREIYERNPLVWSSDFQQVVDEVIVEIDASGSADKGIPNSD